MTPRKPLTLNDYLPSIILQEGEIDYSLVTARELHFFKIYNQTREELSKKYPNPNPPEDEDDTINIAEARQDSKAHIFIEALTRVKTIMDKSDTINLLATDYEKHCIRLYCKVLFNWIFESNKEFMEALTDTDLFEIVESYFKIMRKYHLPTFEDPYYFLSPKRRRSVKYEGEMLKRSTLFDENEIKVSLLEELV